ncbi:MAG: hypothetical protein JG764_990 [Clostridiales bacterium]|nr:hypothetical protein [Clostridiales bacterium]
MLFRRKKLVLIVLCIVLGIVVAYAETNYIRSVYAEVEEVPVLYAKEDISLNSSFTKDNVEYRYFPKNMMSNSMVTDASILKGMVASREIAAGRPIFTGDIARKKIPVLAEGMRKVTFSTTLINSLAGAIDIGDYIDIGFVPKPGLVDPAKTSASVMEKYKAQVLFEKVQIFNITDKEGNKLGRDDRQKNSDNKFASKDKIPAAVTVGLIPEEAITLKDYEQKGSLFVMGR